MSLLRPRWRSLILLLAIAANGFIFLTINVWDHLARYLFTIRNPDYFVDGRVVTISGSIADPTVGEPYAFWITICAVLLVAIVVPVIWLHLRAIYAVGSRMIWLARSAAFLAVLGGLLQVAAAVGITILSNFRFPDHNHEHMLGSYVFFAAQGSAILISSVICLLLSRGPGFEALLSPSRSLVPRMNRLRWKLGFAGILAACLYLVLFLAKDWNFTAGKSLVRMAYVTLEPNVITLYLAYLLTFSVDLWQAAVVKGGRSGQAR